MFLEKIVQVRREKVSQAKKKIPFWEMRRMAEEQISHRLPLSLTQALLREKAKGKVGVIAEIKKASPSKGVLREQLEPEEVARGYAKSGAAAISVLTEEDYFLGSPEYLNAVRAVVSLPLLRKDFIIDPYQIYEAKVLGADAVLLITSLLAAEELKEMIKITEGLGMEALVEAHSLEEVEKALTAGARLIGINNRDLRTFTTKIDVSLKLAPVLKEAGVVMVSESGIRSKEDIKALMTAGYHGILIGEALMRAPDPGKALEVLLA
ncbi:indole-3-glycerol-phosphate synthase [Carboxydothermus islandicus]|uniref:Indole-3-glycerol phosphate synthase n=1 Tax=Carboxydothermus islandicus TaxID=661089 RepID=A0A1L8D1T0_9THEO|nr:indole-3-glycerol phosphate synthase TrpC [Carboxydothermus islandicus]GAV25109.1 indole-3-glycerol-phosphate synthase [Carboxydothermus islandicus]